MAISDLVPGIWVPYGVKPISRREFLKDLAVDFLGTAMRTSATLIFLSVLRDFWYSAPLAFGDHGKFKPGSPDRWVWETVFKSNDDDTVWTHPQFDVGTRTILPLAIARLMYWASARQMA
jgi:hypothetical protein